MARPVIAVTMGDAAGVGPELCLRLLAEKALHEVATPIVFGDRTVLDEVARRLNLPPARTDSVKDFAKLKLNDFTPGQVSAAAGAASYAYLTAAIDAALAKKVDAICTAPINKESLHAAGVTFPGHTEILADRTGSKKTCMMLTSPEITCALVTAHVGYRDVPGLLSVERIFDTIELTHSAMKTMRGYEPRLTMCGLNPHAGEKGLFGDREEERFIVPAMEQARAKGINIEGPFPADTAFLPSRRKITDAYICHYHDQGLIPLKALAFDDAINVTLGLPIVRTSVDHGTAFDIAWQGQASANSLYEAFKLAVKLASSSDSLPEPRA